MSKALAALLALALAGATPCYAQIAQIPSTLPGQPAPPPERSHPGQGFNSPPLGQGANLPPQAIQQGSRPREPQVFEQRPIRPDRNTEQEQQGYSGGGYGGQTVIVSPVLPYGYVYPGQLPPPQVTQPLAQSPIRPNCVQAAPGVTQQIFDASGAPIYCEYPQ